MRELEAFERRLRAAVAKIAAARKELAKVRARREREIDRFALKKHGNLAEAGWMRDRLDGFLRADESLAGAQEAVDEAIAEARDV